MKFVEFFGILSQLRFPQYQPFSPKKWDFFMKTSQKLRMLSSVTINCQITKIVMNSGSQLSEL